MCHTVNVSGTLSVVKLNSMAGYSHIISINFDAHCIRPLTKSSSFSAARQWPACPIQLSLAGT